MTALDESVTRTQARTLSGAAQKSSWRLAFDTITHPSTRSTTATGSRVAGIAPVAAPLAPLPALDASLQAAVSPRVQPALEQRQLWERRYRRQLRVVDSSAIIAVTGMTALIEAMLIGPAITLQQQWLLGTVFGLTAGVWLLLLSLFQTRDSRILGSGATEYKRVAHATGLAFGLVAILFIIVQASGLRLQLLIALPTGIVALLAGRWFSRRWLVRKRRSGLYASRAVVIGRRADVAHVITSIQRDGASSYNVVGITIDELDDRSELTVGGATFTSRGNVSTAARVAAELGADTVIVASHVDADPDFIRRLSWQLEGTAAELVLSSRLTDVAGPRISLRQVEGLPLIQVQIPTFEGGKHLLKRAFDIVVSSLALLAIGIATPFIALAIYIDSPGPVFFRQLRVGRDGQTFRMWKFRSMKTSAEQDLIALQAQSDGNGVLFKMKDDPRVTRVGRILRKFSIDELPQFFNVLVGDMSIVGPRPPLPSEVAAYDGDVSRRLFVNPGITGLWQVSGRSDLSWDESVRLDLRYVENWSLISDMMIMWRTVRVMIRPTGAY